MLVTLSDGTQVHMLDRFTHGAEMAYYEAVNKGAVEKQYTEDGKIVREVPVVNVALAMEAALLAMIKSVKVKENEIEPTIAWLRSLDEPDYDDLNAKLAEIRKATREKIAEGKKNS